MQVWTTVLGNRDDRLGKAFEPIDHCGQDVLDRAVAQLAHYPQPKLRAFGLFDPDAQDSPCAPSSELQWPDTQRDC
jgi:hypothetical protein